MGFYDCISFPVPRLFPRTLDIMYSFALLLDSLVRIILYRTITQIYNVLNYCNSFRLITGALERQHSVFEKPEFMVILKTSEMLQAESGQLHIFKNITYGSPRRESKKRTKFPNTIPISFIALRK